MDEQAASQLLMQSIQLLRGNAGDLLTLARPTFIVPIHALEAVCGLLPAASETVHVEVARLIATQSPPPDPLVPYLARAVDLLDFDQVSDPDREALWEFARRDSSQCGTAVLGWLAANGNCDARAKVVARATQGDLDALSALGDLRTLDETAAATLIEHLRSMAAEILSEAHGGSFLGDNRGETLALLNLLFPSQARWDEVIELLRHPFVTVDHKCLMCFRIALLSSRLPEDVGKSLAANIDDISIAQPEFAPTDMAGAQVVLAIAIKALDGDDADAAIARLASGSQRERQNAARSLGLGQSPNMDPILAALIGDRDSQVRAEAARAIGWLASTNAKEWVTELAPRVAAEDCRLLPLSLLDGLSKNLPIAEAGVEIARQLRSHASALVRRKAFRLLSSGSEDHLH